MGGFALRPYRDDDEDAAIVLWHETWQKAYPEIDFGKRVEMGIRNDRYKAMCPTVVGPLRLRSRVHAREARLAVFLLEGAAARAKVKR